MPALKVVAFQPAQWALYRDLRLMALKDSPEAFGGTYAQAARVSDAVWASRLANADGVRDLPLLLLVDDVAAGMAWGTMDRTSTETACVYQMWVAPEYRGLGGGSLLLDQIIAWARERQVCQLILTVACGLSPARTLYDRSGFTAVGAPEPLRAGSELRVQPMRLSLAG